MSETADTVTLSAKEHALLHQRIADDHRRAQAHVGEAEELRVHNRLLDEEIAVLHTTNDATAAIEAYRVSVEAGIQLDHARLTQANAQLTERVAVVEGQLAVALHKLGFSTVDELIAACQA